MLTTGRWRVLGATTHPIHGFPLRAVAEELVPNPDAGAGSPAEPWLTGGGSPAEPGLTGAGEPGPTSVRADDPEAAKYWRGAPAPAAAAVQPRYRHQWFQTESRVEVAVLAKRLAPERVRVEIAPRRLRVVVRPESGGDGDAFDWDVELAGAADPGASRWAVLSSKIEVVLAKARPGPWPALEAARCDPGSGPQAQPEAGAPAPAAPEPGPELGAGLYPYAGCAGGGECAGSRAG